MPAPIRSPSWDPPKTPLTDKKIREYILAGKYGEEKKKALEVVLAAKRVKTKRKKKEPKKLDYSDLV